MADDLTPYLNACNLYFSLIQAEQPQQPAAPATSSKQLQFWLAAHPAAQHMGMHEAMPHAEWQLLIDLRHG